MDGGITPMKIPCNDGSLWGLSDYEARKDGGISIFFFPYFHSLEANFFQHVAISKPEIMQILNMDFFYHLWRW